MTDYHRGIQEQLARTSWGILGNQGYVLGIDLGGYGLRIVLVDLQKHSYTAVHEEVASTEPTAVLEQACSAIRTLLADADAPADRLVRIGVGFGGPVDTQNGVVLLSPRMSGWQNFSIKNYFEQAFDTVTLVDNDANLIALGEATFGVGRGCHNLFYLHLSSGVGGGIVLDGHLYHGSHAIAGEVGHALVVRDWAERGQVVTLEELVSIKGVLDRAQELGVSTTNLNDVFGANAIGQQVVAETVDILAMRLTQIMALLDPQIIVLGGIVVRIGGDAFVGAIAQRMNDYMGSTLARPTNVVASVLGNESIAIGALALALDSLQE